MLTKPVAALLLAGALAGSVFGVRQTRLSDFRAIGPAQQRVKGSPHAKLSVVEYFDYQCGACRTAYKLFEAYEKAKPGSLRVEMRYYPLPGHPHGMRAAIYAECAAEQGKFWPFHDAAMENQRTWSRLADPASRLRAYAVEAGVNPSAFDACTANPETEIRVVKEKEAGYGIGVRLTPTCLINGELVTGSNAVTERLKKEFGEIEVKL